MHLNNLKSGWRKIKMIDQYLIIIMIILIVYSISTIFIGNADSDITGNVDIVIRTTIASIFGYFISSNFIKNEQSFSLHTEVNQPQVSQLVQMENTSVRETTINNKIGFTADNVMEDSSGSIQQSLGSLETIKISSENGIFSQNNQLQIHIIGTLCICSILVMICTRFFASSGSTDSATLSQFRDIVCGSIGFLIGMPSSAAKD